MNTTQLRSLDFSVWSKLSLQPVKGQKQRHWVTRGQKRLKTKQASTGSKAFHTIVTTCISKTSSILFVDCYQCNIQFTSVHIWRSGDLSSVRQLQRCRPLHCTITRASIATLPNKEGEENPLKWFTSNSPVLANWLQTFVLHRLLKCHQNCPEAMKKYVSGEKPEHPLLRFPSLVSSWLPCPVAMVMLSPVYVRGRYTQTQGCFL